MISNDLVSNVSSFMLLFFLILWGGCFFIFVYRYLGGPKVGKDSLLYFNYIFLNGMLYQTTHWFFLFLDILQQR